MEPVKFTDRRGREWEWFIDESYYDCTCVRTTGDKNFNSPTSFHFPTSAKAKEFVELLKISE